MAKLRIELDIPADKYLALYDGRARDIYAVAEGGLRVQFPGAAMRRFVTRDGVFGSFELHFDTQRKLIGVERVN